MHIPSRSHAGVLSSILLGIGLASCSSSAPAPVPSSTNGFVATQFDVPSKDGLARITGEIDVPNCLSSPAPAVMLVAGTGLFYRNGFFGKSGTDRDLIFLDLTNRFASACIATVRFDFRGVHCDLKTPADSKCLDQGARAAVTDQTILDDIQVVYDFATRQPSIDPKRFGLMGHSEGSLNIARLVAAGSIQPAVIVFYGGITESAKSIMHFQLVDEIVDWAFQLDTNGDGVLTNDEITARFPGSRLARITSADAILSPTGSWTRGSLTDLLEGRYSALSADVLGHSDTDPYLMSGVTFSSYRWLKRWFTDDRTVLDELKGFPGAIEYHSGDMDSQAPGLREQAFMNVSSVPMASKPSFVIYPGKGHTLGADMLFGPMDATVADELVAQVKRGVLSH